MSTQTAKAPDLVGDGLFAIVELMGHVRMAGWLSQVTVAGVAMLRLDVPGDAPDDGKGPPRPGLTQAFHPSSIYRLTPCDEETARAVAAANRPRPVQHYEMPGLPAAGAFSADDYEDEEDDVTF